MTTWDVPQERPKAVVRAWRAFGRWRGGRPFWGGLLLILSGLEFYTSGHLNLLAVHVQIGPEGFLTWVIPLVLTLCGLLLWFTPGQRIFYGVVGAAVAVYGLMGLNLGGFVVGMLLGIIGGSLGAAWTPVVPRSVEAPGAGPEDEGIDAGPEDEGVDAGHEGEGVDAGHEGEGLDEQEPEERDATVEEILSGPLTDHLPTSTTSPLGTPPVEEPGTGNGGGSLPRRTPRMLVLILVGSVAATTALVAGQTPRPAVAAPCPTAAATTGKPATSANSTAKTSTGGGTNAGTGGGSLAAPAPAPAASPTPTPTATAGSGGGNPVGNAVGGLLNTIGRLLGVPQGTGTPPPSPTPTPGAKSSPTTGATRSVTVPTGRGTPKAGASSRVPKASPTPTGCQQLVSGSKTAALPPGQPLVNEVPSTQIAATLTQTTLNFQGTVDVPTKTGSIRAMEFTMDQSVSTPFELRVPFAGHTLSIKSSKLTVSGHVTFFATEVKGNLLGLVPLDLTPDKPLLLDLLKLLPNADVFFTDAQVQLVFVQSDVLTADALNISYSA